MLFSRLFQPKLAVALALGAAALGSAGLAHAGGVYWSVGVNAVPGVSVGVANARPVYVQPAPVYVQPAPVYVQPAPVAVVPQTIYTVPPVTYTQPQVVYPAGAVTYYQQRPVVVGVQSYPYAYGAPVYRSGWAGDDWRHRQWRHHHHDWD